MHWIAKLGEFLGRKGDGKPGVNTLWGEAGKICMTLRLHGN